LRLEWPSVSIVYQYGKSTYRIKVYQTTDNERSHWRAGKTLGHGNVIPLVDSGTESEVEVFFSLNEV
jgi:hypothetical protein